MSHIYMMAWMNRERSRIRNQIMEGDIMEKGGMGG